MAEFFADRKSACATWNTVVLKGHCFVFRLECLHLKSNYANIDDYIDYISAISQRIDLKFCMATL